MMAKVVSGTTDMVVFEQGEEFKDTAGNIVKIPQGETVRVYGLGPEYNLVAVQRITIENRDQSRWEVKVKGGTLEDFVKKAVKKSKEG